MWNCDDFFCRNIEMKICWYQMISRNIPGEWGSSCGIVMIFFAEVSKWKYLDIKWYQAISQESEGGESAFPGRRQNLPKPPTLWAGGRNKDIFLFRCLSYKQWFSIGLSVCLLSGQVAPLNKWTLFQSHRLNQGSFFILCSLWGHPKCLNDLGKTLPTIFFVCLTGLL